MSVENTIMPFGIYHHIDSHTKTCLCHIYRIHGKHMKTVNKSIIFLKNRINQYSLHSSRSFYAIKPTLRPIPKGLHLFCARKSSKLSI